MRTTTGCCLILLAAASLLAQPRSKLAAPQPLPPTFPEVFQKVVQAREDGFKSTRGAPLLGSDITHNGRTLGHEFLWRSTIILPGAKSCVIAQDQTSLEREGQTVVLDNPSSARYSCDMQPIRLTEIAAGIEAALGPGWSRKVEGSAEHAAAYEAALGPEWSREGSVRREVASISFHQNGDEYEGKNIYTVGVSQWSGPGERLSVSVLQHPLIKPDEPTGVGAAIARIESSEHAPLPPAQKGSGVGPIQIHNDTSSTITVYFSGTINHQEVVQPGQHAAVPLPPGPYKVAAELADKSVTPFLGTRKYSGGETERFYISLH
jgi:hypothetical protein